MPRLELFLFRYRNTRTGKWILAGYRAERREIAARYAEFEIIGSPEIREIDCDRRRFDPHAVAAKPSGQAAGTSPHDASPSRSSLRSSNRPRYMGSSASCSSCFSGGT